jgi:hypothetical protein
MVLLNISTNAPMHVIPYVYGEQCTEASFFKAKLAPRREVGTYAVQMSRVGASSRVGANGSFKKLPSEA